MENRANPETAHTTVNVTRLVLRTAMASSPWRERRVPNGFPEAGKDPSRPPSAGPRRRPALGLRPVTFPIEGKLDSFQTSALWIRNELFLLKYLLGMATVTNPLESRMGAAYCA